MFQESIFSQPLLKSFGLYLTFIQFILYSMFAFIETWLAGSPSRRFISNLLLISHIFQNI